jgi:hypothetical protein
VVTRPAGATVAIDGAAAGRTPLVAHVAAGHHEVVLTKDRYATTTTATNAPGHVRLDLKRPPATLRITSTPSQAEVVIGGEPRGLTPLEIKLPAYERYAVRVNAPGGRTWSKTVYLNKLTNRVDAKLGGGSGKPAASSRSGRR